MLQKGLHSDDPGSALRPVPPDDQDGHDVSLGVHDDVLSELRRETESMLLFALSEGLPLDDATIKAVDGLASDQQMSVTHLVGLHTRLARAIAPAKPRAMNYLRPASRSAKSQVLGISPGMRWLSGAALLFTLCFFVVSLSGEITADNMRQSIYELDGYPLAMHLLLVMSAAGIGATFAVLFDLWNDINLRRYDPINESGMWLRVALGLVAGLVLSEIVRSDTVLTAGGGTGDATEEALMSGPLLALAGGFSANILHIVLNSIVGAFRRAFGADEPDDITARRDARAVSSMEPAVASQTDAATLAPSPKADRA